MCVMPCSASADQASYRLNGGTQCCWKSATESLLGTGVLTCLATQPTTVGEYAALTCDAGFGLISG